VVYYTNCRRIYIYIRFNQNQLSGFTYVMNCVLWMSFAAGWLFR